MNYIPKRPVDIMFPGRREAIAGGRCMEPPIGCGGEATVFDDELSRREFAISGLCQECQNAVFDMDSEQYMDEDPKCNCIVTCDDCKVQVEEKLF